MDKMLTKAEEQVMQTLWRLKKSGLREITEAMPAPQPHSNTVATVLKILNEKGFVAIEQLGRINSYSPSVSKKEYSKRSIKQLAEGYFEGSFNKVVSFLVDSKSVSVEDLEELIKNLKKE